jgi:hypothetical protein
MARTARGRHTILLVPGIHVLMNWLATRFAATARWLRFAERVLMNRNEYEERFRRSAPSWHQILTVNQSPNRSRRRRLRWLVVGVLIGALTLTTEMASHRMAHSHAGQRPAAEPEADLLAGKFRHVLELFQISWTFSGVQQPVAPKRPMPGVNR